MNILIKGMKLPKTGRVDISIDPKGKIYSKTSGLAFWKYAAVEIPDMDEWCTDCKEYDQERHCCPRFNRVIRTAISEVEITEDERLSV